MIRQDVGQPLVVDLGALGAITDYHQALRTFGPPHRIGQTENGMVFLYEEVDLTERQVGVNLTTNDIALFKAVVAREYAERRTLLMLFDAAGRAQSVNYREWSDIAGEGAALQFVFVVAGVADEGDLNDSPAAHDWGFGLLEPDLARALNRENSLDRGHAGVELKGTPTNIGQHALELR